MYNEIISLAAVIVIGIILGIMFDFYRVINYILQPRLIIVWLLDIIYTAIIIIFGFAALLMVNWAEFRLYIYIGIVGGAIAYFYWCSRFVYRLFIKGADGLLKLYIWLVRLYRRFSRRTKNKVAK